MATPLPPPLFGATPSALPNGTIPALAAGDYLTIERDADGLVFNALVSQFDTRYTTITQGVLAAAIGDTVQAYSANLDAWAAVVPDDYLTVAAGDLAYQPLNAYLSQFAGLTPGPATDGYVVAWDDGAETYALVAQSGGTSPPFVDETALVFKTGSPAITATFDANALTQARVYGLPDASTTLAGLSVAQTFTTTQTIATATATNTGLIVKTTDDSISNYLLNVQNAGGASLSRLTAAGVYQIADPDQLVGYAEFYHDHASNNSSFPRTYFRGYAASGSPVNYGLYAASGDAVGVTQVPVFFGVSTNTNVSQSSAKQIVFYQSSSRSVIATMTAEQSTATPGSPLYFSTRDIFGGNAAICVNNNTNMSVMIGAGATPITVAQLYVRQASTTGVIPVITLEQADVDKVLAKIIGTSDSGAVDRTLVKASDFPTPGAIALWIQIEIEDGRVGGIPAGDYYWPLYAAPS